MGVLVINAGSSSVKFGLFQPGHDWQTVVSGTVAWSPGNERAELTLRHEGTGAQTSEISISPGYTTAVRSAIEMVSRNSATAITGVGQRVVHGGARLLSSVRIDETVKNEIRDLIKLAPLHNPAAIAAIEATAAELPGVPQVAVFDTAFYRTLHPTHFIYPLPYAWYEEWGVRRFGFHGISHDDCAQRVAARLGGQKTGLRVISCHLGNGCSATATVGGSAVATTMGFTPLDGLMMGTRPGSLDPGIVSHVQRQHGLTAEQIEDVLNHGAGLLGVSGVSSDYRQVQAAASTGHQRAQLALGIYAGRVREAVGSLAVTLGGADALVFTGGVGEHAADLRAEVCRGLSCLGLHLDAAKNQSCGQNADDEVDLTAEGAGGRILMMRAQEELAIARDVARVLGCP